MARQSINSDAAFAATSTGRMGRISGIANVQSHTVNAESPAFRSVSCRFHRAGSLTVSDSDSISIFRHLGGGKRNRYESRQHNCWRQRKSLHSGKVGVAMQDRRQLESGGENGPVAEVQAERLRIPTQRLAEKLG